MKNLSTYYFAILLPLPLLYLSGQHSSVMFVSLLILYLLYRGVVDGKRLIDKGLIKEKEVWKAFVPLYTAFYFRELYFEK
jgi:uncharacterized membrane protein